LFSLMNPQKIVPLLLDWFRRTARDLPWRRTQDPYAIWVSEIMLQQTQVKAVVPYWERWMGSLPTIASLAAAKPQKIHKLWEGLRYYSRVRNMQKAARLIMSKHGGRFPNDFDEILELPGIGRYTAGAISSIAFNQPRPILDGNVIRVLTRVFAIEGNPNDRKVNESLWQLAQSLVLHSARNPSTNNASQFNQSLMELGALVCAPKMPRCPECPVSSLCMAFRTGRVEELPQRPSKAPPTTRRFAAFVAENRGRLLVRQRPAGVVNAHLWEFPNLEVDRGNGDARHLAQILFGRETGELKSLCTIKHSITRYRITLQAFRVCGKAGELSRAELKNARWLLPAQLRKLPFTSAHKKILEMAIKSEKPSASGMRPGRRSDQRLLTSSP